MIRLFLTSVQKYGRWIAFEKCENVGCDGSQVGSSEMICSSCLNAVEIIQYTGKTMTTNSAIPTTFSTASWMRRRRLT